MITSMLVESLITVSPEYIISLHLSDCVILFVSFFPPASLCSSASPYHEVMRMERRLRSSSEGAGGPRIHGNHREAPGMEGCGLLKHRNNSSSSKLGSLVGLKLSVFVCVFIRQQCPLMIMSSVVVCAHLW